jgi:D-alanyl-D-alanine carboxypeptidase
MKLIIAALIPILASALAACAPQALQTAEPPRTELQSSVEAAVAAGADPIAIYVTGAGVERPYGAAAGKADPTTGRALTPETPVRVASNTKTFVAATILRLWEKGRINLDSPIEPLLDPKLTVILKSDGYRTDQITVRHLLSHSGGLYDHGSDPRYVKTVMAEPDHRWTREEQIRLATEYADPQSPPGTSFRYSDDGYILLGDIVERITAKNLARAVRDELRLDRLGLSSTWWEIFEQAPRRSEPRARQYMEGQEVTNLHASLDLYGGGGLVMSPRDLATFTAALFENRIFQRPETLREMLWKGPHKGAEKYRLGIFVEEAGGQQFYSHSGFWGTVTYYNPQRRIAVAGATTNPASYGKMLALVKQTVGMPAIKP